MANESVKQLKHRSPEKGLLTTDLDVLKRRVDILMAEVKQLQKAREKTYGFFTWLKRYLL